jgi:SAM-dependent methyltransferase
MHYLEVYPLFVGVGVLSRSRDLGKGAQGDLEMTAKGYGEDLAYIHDVGFGHFARNAAPGLLELLQQGVRGCVSARRNLVIDLGCGSGIWARELSDAGYQVLGVDQSKAMLAIARERVLEGEFRRSSFLTAALPRCVALTAIGECFNYVFDPRNTKGRLRGLFRRVYDALVPGGLFIFDVAGAGRIPPPGTQKKFWEGEDWATLVEAMEDRQQMLLTRRITSFRRIGKLYRRDEEVHRQRLYERSELAGLLRDCGFRVRGLHGYGRMRFPPGLFGFVGRKP